MYLTYYIIPVFLSILLIVGIKKNSYESFINGCKRGVEIALDAFPYLLAMIFATKLLNSSMIFMTILKNYDIPHLLFLEGIFRPMSNNASLSILIQIFNDFGIDSNMGIAASVLQGATETSFYVITIYYGTVGIKKYPYSLIMAIISDILIFIFSLILFYFIL